MDESIGTSRRWTFGIAFAACAPGRERTPDFAAKTCTCGLLIAGRGRLRVACGQGTLLEPTEIQLEGRKRLASRDFLNGVKISSGEKVG